MYINTTNCFLHSRLKRLLLPALVDPAITTCTPLRSRSPLRSSERCVCISTCSLDTAVSTAWIEIKALHEKIKHPTMTVLMSQNCGRCSQTRGRNPTWGRLIYKWGSQENLNLLFCFMHLFYKFLLETLKADCVCAVIFSNVFGSHIHI